VVIVFVEEQTNRHTEREREGERERETETRLMAANQRYGKSLGY